jgi:hypothetical protein
LEAYAAAAKVEAADIAAGFEPRPDLDLTFRGGRTIVDLVFVNRYLGGKAAWDDRDRQAIDRALSAVMRAPGLQGIIQQYFDEPISSTMLPSDYVEGALRHRFTKADVERTAVSLFRDGVLGDADPANAIVNLMLPRGTMLVDDEDAAEEGEEGEEGERKRRVQAVLVEDEAADSLHGLGGFHGSVHVGHQTVYYSVGVYSEGGNGIVAFDEPWKNVVATFYHELNEFQTDPDVEDVIRTGDESLLGWYSTRGGEIGDIPMTLAGRDLSLVMQEVELADGDVDPVQLQWSNREHGPERPIQPVASAVDA